MAVFNPIGDIGGIGGTMSNPIMCSSLVVGSRDSWDISVDDHREAKSVNEVELAAATCLDHAFF